MNTQEHQSDGKGERGTILTRSPLVRFWRRWANWRGIRAILVVMVSLISLWALACGVENLRAKWAWDRCRAELEAKGEKLDYRAFLPPAIRDDQNFAATPFWKGLLDIDYSPKATNRFRDTNAWARSEALQIDIALPKDPEFRRTNTLNRYGPGMGRLDRGERCDLKLWQQMFRYDSNYPAYPTPRSPAEDVLKALTRFDDVINEIREGARRPHTRFDLRYEEGFNVLLPHLAKMKSLVNILSLRAIAQMESGNGDAALEDIRMLFRVSDAAQSDPLIISSLVAIACDALGAQPIWHGVATHRWNDRQLATLQELLVGRQLYGLTHRSLRFERGLVNLVMDQLVRSDNVVRALASLGMGDEPAGLDVPAAIAAGLQFLGPRGWIRQNQVLLNRLYQEVLNQYPPALNPGANVEDRGLEDRMMAELNGAFLPYRVIARMLFPAVSKIFAKGVAGQVRNSTVVTGLALERYRLAEGKYPDQLDALVPRFLSAVPTDHFSGQPLTYRVRSDGSRVVYSVGDNRVDDGGEAILKKRPQDTSGTPGDIVWVIPAS